MRTKGTTKIGVVDTVDIGGQVRALREEQGLTQRQLARKADLAIGTVSRAESGGFALSAASVDRLARALGMEPSAWPGVVSREPKGRRVPELGRRLRAARMERGLSQEALARRAGVLLGTVGLIERGGSVDPHLSTLTAIAGALGVSVSEFLEGMEGAKDG